MNVFEFLSCIEVYKAKWLSSECLKPSVKSKRPSFNGAVSRLTLACSDMESSFFVYIV